MKRELSAGGIVFNNQGEVLLIKNASMTDPKKEYWGLPKGLIEQGEKPEQAALREVKEETGIEAKIITRVGYSKYVYPFQGERIFKVVTVFLMEYISGEINHQKSELSDAQWVNSEKALKILSFSNDKILLNKALELSHG